METTRLTPILMFVVKLKGWLLSLHRVNLVEFSACLQLFYEF